jgi:hypothetical protein
MTYVSSAARPTSFSDRYLVLLCAALFGYAIIGKGFAYLGLAPLFVGELALFAGFVVLLRTGCLVASLATLPSIMLAVTMSWCCCAHCLSWVCMASMRCATAS